MLVSAVPARCCEMPVVVPEENRGAMIYLVRAGCVVAAGGPGRFASSSPGLWASRQRPGVRRFLDSRSVGSASAGRLFGLERDVDGNWLP